MHSRVTLENIPEIISHSENLELTRTIIEDEIQMAVWGLAPDKAPGPESFTIHFFKECWNIIKVDIKRMLKYVQKSFRIGGSTNSSFLALIPKEVNPSLFQGSNPSRFVTPYTKCYLR